MHPGIVVRYEGERGCGRRAAGRMYLVCDGAASTCGKLPVPLDVCPCCGMGVKPSRAPQWLEQPERLWADMTCKAGERNCATCPMSASYETGPAVLIWVGEKFYKSAAEFMRETRMMGVSRFIKHIPRGFVLGQTWVLLAHRKAIEIAPLFSREPQYQQGIFGMFKPTRIEIIVRGDEPDSVIEDYISRGLTPVLVKERQTQPTPPDPEQTSMF